MIIIVITNDAVYWHEYDRNNLMMLYDHNEFMIVYDCMIVMNDRNDRMMYDRNEFNDSVWS